MIYPFENVKIRMAADLEKDRYGFGMILRYYSNIRDCIKKVRKH